MLRVRTTLQSGNRNLLSRESPEKIKETFLSVSSHLVLTQLLDAMPIICLLLNEKRQIVFANRATLNFLQVKDRYALSGQRPGEALQCIHASEENGGCGATQSCRLCGVDQALLSAHGAYEKDHNCRIVRNTGMQTLVFRVSAVPTIIGGQSLILLTMVDVGHEKGRILASALSHTVFDAKGTMGESGETESCPAEESDNEQEMPGQPAISLPEDAEGQRGVDGNEDAESEAGPAAIDAHRLLEEIKDQFDDRPEAKGRLIRVAPESEQVTVRSDPVLLRRVLAGLITSALEASREKDVVLLGADARHGTVEFWVRYSRSTEAEAELSEGSFPPNSQGRGLGNFAIFRVTLPEDSSG